jgi:hypothetical protein
VAAFWGGAVAGRPCSAAELRPVSPARGVGAFLQSNSGHESVARALLLSWLFVGPLAEPDAGPATVLVDELDAARIQCRVNLFNRIASST